MRRRSVRFLLPIFLFGALVPGQAQEELTRLPVLWGHYQTHRQEVPETTFFQYFKLHYGDGFAKHRSAHDHSKLPMKSGENHLHAPAPTDLPEFALVHLQLPPTVGKAPVFIDQIYSFLLLHDIWQPPKSC
ncbi:MAG: hypothetical protein HY842_09045 [Bacteroidetes bacterium]|nr:hypothetical protein [Bacteroidota bacterium]